MNKSLMGSSYTPPPFIKIILPQCSSVGFLSDSLKTTCGSEITDDVGSIK